MIQKSAIEIFGIKRKNKNRNGIGQNDPIVWAIKRKYEIEHKNNETFQYYNIMIKQIAEHIRDKETRDKEKMIEANSGNINKMWERIKLEKKGEKLKIPDKLYNEGINGEIKYEANIDALTTMTKKIYCKLAPLKETDDTKNQYIENEEDEMITDEDMDKALKHLESKTPGMTGTTINQIRWGGETMIKLIMRLYKNIWEQNYIPERMRYDVKPALPKWGKKC